MFNKHHDRATGGWGGKCGGFNGGRGWGGQWAQQRFGGHKRVPANIEETDSSFTISLYAAGLTKENIQLSVKEDVLTISYKGSDSQGDSNAGQTDNFTHREFTNASFERSFLLNNKVLIENITAAYADGILTVTLPKNPESNKPAQSINVA